MKYLAYTSYVKGQTGLSNTIMSIEVGIVLAFLTNRVLILEGDIPPPANPVDYQGAITNAYQSRVSDLFAFPVPWMAADAIDLRSYDAHELTEQRLMDCVFYYPPDLDTSTADFMAFARGRRHFLTYDETCEQATVLKLSGGPAGGYRPHNLTFYSSFFYLDPPTRKAVYTMLRGMRPKPYITAFVERVVQDLGAFNAVHIRRGDFKATYGTTTLVRTPQDVLDALEPHFDRRDRLLIVTDEADDPFFHDIVLAYPDHVFIDRFILENYRDEFIDLPYHDNIMLAFLSQLIAAASKDFIGTMTSTFTSLIQRYRGNQGKSEPFKFLWNELPEPGDKVERGRHAVSTCVPLQHGVMVEEYAGPYSWNRYNPRMNPAWQREWPESFLHAAADAAASPHGTRPMRLGQQRNEIHRPPIAAEKVETPQAGPFDDTAAAPAMTTETQTLALQRETLTVGTPSVAGRVSSTQPSIFVSIASYCDPELPRTLNDCLQNAKHPERLRFGICWQYDPQHHIGVTPFQRDKRFRFVTYPIAESQGGTWARSIAQQFWDGEAYTLQVDSHMKFEPAWDETLIRMIRQLPSDKPLITVNSPLFWYDNQGRLHRETDKGIRTTKAASWHASSGWAPWFDWGKRNTKVPGRSRFISGNFVFTLGQWNVEVPQDPEHYYWGEEFSLTVRSYTHGYDFFLPREIVAWHLYHVNGPPRRHWEYGEAVVQQKNRVAFERLHWLLYSDAARDHERLGVYGLGTQRSKHDYERYAGMDFTHKKAHPDVYTGENPDPVTIRCEADWQCCLTFAEYERFRKLSMDRLKPSG